MVIKIIKKVKKKRNCTLKQRTIILFLGYPNKTNIIGAGHLVVLKSAGPRVGNKVPIKTFKKSVQRQKSTNQSKELKKYFKLI